MAGKNNANIGFEKQIWNAACELWGHIPAADYRKVIVGLIFLRYISAAFEKRYNQLVANMEGNKVFHRDVAVVWICTNCGHIHIGKDAPQVCPVCAHPQAYFEIKSDNY